MKSKININQLKLYGYHGCLPEEEIAGARFFLDVEIDVDFIAALDSDKLKDTIDYEAVINTVKEAFSERSKLIEHVGGRIIRRLKKTFPDVTHVKLTIHKPSAPISAEFSSVSVTIEG